MSSKHSNQSDSVNYPKATGDQMLMINGFMLGDGCIHAPKDRTPWLEVKSIRREFIDWLSKQFFELVSGIDEYEPPEDHWGNEIQYTLRTRSLPWLQNLRDRWYHDGNRILPNRFSLSRLTAKMWYVGDGSLSWSENGTLSVSIGANSLEKWEYEIGVEFARRDLVAKFSSGTIYFNQYSSEKFLDWLGEPVPGYEYKFARTKEGYEELKPSHLKN